MMFKRAHEHVVETTIEKDRDRRTLSCISGHLHQDGSDITRYRIPVVGGFGSSFEPTVTVVKIEFINLMEVFEVLTCLRARVDLEPPSLQNLALWVILFKQVHPELDLESPIQRDTWEALLVRHWVDLPKVH